MSKKDCMFQYVTVYYNYLQDYKNHEDTRLITLAEAKKLWYKWLPQFIKELQDEDARPEMGIWVNCKDNIDYHTTAFHVDSDSETDGKNVWEVKRKPVKP